MEKNAELLLGNLDTDRQQKKKKKNEAARGDRLITNDKSGSVTCERRMVKAAFWICGRHPCPGNIRGQV